MRKIACKMSHYYRKHNTSSSIGEAHLIHSLTTREDHANDRAESVIRLKLLPRPRLSNISISWCFSCLAKTDMDVTTNTQASCMACMQLCPL